MVGAGGVVNSSAWSEKESKKFRESKETEAAIKVLEFISTLGMTQEQALEVAEKVYILSKMDCVQSRRETPYTAVHVSKDDIDFMEYFEIKKAIP